MRILGNAAQAHDVVQDVFLRVWRRPSAFDARRGEIGSYLRLMARSRALDLWREGQAAGRASDRLKIVESTGVGRRRGHARRRCSSATTTRETVREALQQLPEPQREALVLAYWGGLTADEIARREHVPLGTAKSRIRLGMASCARNALHSRSTPPRTTSLTLERPFDRRAGRARGPAG